MEAEMENKHKLHDNLNGSEEKTFTEMPYTTEAIRPDSSQEEYLTRIISHLADVEDRHSNRRLRELMTKFLLIICALACLATFSLLFFNGFELTHLSDRVLIALLFCVPVPIIARLVFIIAKHLFPGGR
jgi:hypothetical protein